MPWSSQNPSDHRAGFINSVRAKDEADDLALEAIALEPKAPEAYLQSADVYSYWNQPERSKEILLR